MCAPISCAIRAASRACDSASLRRGTKEKPRASCPGPRLLLCYDLPKTCGGRALIAPEKEIPAADRLHYDEITRRRQGALSPGAGSGSRWLVIRKPSVM